MFKEVSVVQVREVLRRWLSGNDGLRRVADAAGVDRKTARRYVEAAESLGVKRNGGEPQLTEEVLAAVVDKVRPGRPAGHGGAWELLGSHHEKLKELVVVKGLTVVKAGDLLARQGLVVPERTLHRYCAEHFPGNAERGTVRLADPEPGKELQADFGKMGLLFDPVQARRRVVHALVLVAVLSRHMFVWLTFTQTTQDVIEGLETAWEFFRGIFAVLIPDNLTPVITKAEPTGPRINDTFLEYSQDRGFLIDAARARHPRDKARCERQVPYVRSRFFAGEDFVDLSDANRRAVSWCLDGAGGRVHGTTRCKPLEAFMALEQPVLIPTPRRTLRHATYGRAQGAPRPPCRGAEGPLHYSRGRHGGEDGLCTCRLEDRQVLLQGPANKGPPKESARRALDGPGRPAQGKDRLRDARHQAPS